MANLKLKGDWNELKGTLKKQFAKLTDDDLLYEEGKSDQLIGRIQKKTGMAVDDIRAMIFESEYHEEDRDF